MQATLVIIWLRTIHHCTQH